MDIDWKQLARAAAAATANANSPDHVVGAAVLASDGQIYTGANHAVNNHRSTIHAEDSAVAAMLGAHHRLRVLALITVAFDFLPDGSKSPLYFTYPCGSCRNLVFQYTAYGTPDEAQVFWGLGDVRTISEIYPVSPDDEQVPDHWLG